MITVTIVLARYNVDKSIPFRGLSWARLVKCTTGHKD